MCPISAVDGGMTAIEVITQGWIEMCAYGGVPEYMPHATNARLATLVTPAPFAGFEDTILFVQIAGIFRIFRIVWHVPDVRLVERSAQKGDDVPVLGRLPELYDLPGNRYNVTMYHDVPTFK
jgi:hypothetical protein